MIGLKLYEDPYEVLILLRRGKSHMSQSKILAFHVEGNTQKELRANVRAGLAELEGQLAPGKAPAAATDAAPAKAAKGDKPAKKTKASGATIEQVKEALTALKEAGEIKTVKKILKKYDAAVSDKLDPEHYDAVIAAAKAAMPEEDSEDDDDADGDEGDDEGDGDEDED